MGELLHVGLHRRIFNTTGAPASGFNAYMESKNLDEADAPQLARTVCFVEMQASDEMLASLSLLFQRTFNIADKNNDMRVDRSEWIAYHTLTGASDETLAANTWEAMVAARYREAPDSDLLMTDWVAYHMGDVSDITEEEMKHKIVQAEQLMDGLMESIHTPESTVAALEAAFPSMNVKNK